jgi:hypothetical protein
MRIHYTNANKGVFNGLDVDMSVSVSYQGQTYPAKVTQTPFSVPFTMDKNLAEKNSSMMIIDFIQDPPDAALGDNASFTIVESHKDDVIKIPRVALHASAGGYFVQVIDGSIRKALNVETGLVTATEVEIVKGLKEGQQIVL